LLSLVTGFCMRRLLAVIASGPLVAIAFAATAAAAPKVNGVFDLTGSPQYLTQGPDGNIWTTLSGSGVGNDVARIAPDGTVTEFDAPSLAGSVGITAGQDGNLWVTRSAAVAKFPPADPTSATPFAVADITDPRAVTGNEDGNLWTASGDKLLKIPPADPTTYTPFTINGMGARGIAAGSDGTLWIADFGSARIVNATTAGTPTFYPVGGGPQEVEAGKGGQAAYANPGADPQELGRINPGGDPKPTKVPNTDPFGIALGADGAYWVAQFLGNNLGRLTSQGKYTTLDGLPAGSGPRQITAGPNRTLWVGLELTGQVARVTGLKARLNTKITKRPRNRVSGRKGGAKVKYKFKTKPASAKSQCKLKRRGKRNKRERRLAKFRSCRSPKRYRRLRSGRYKFAVRAVKGKDRDKSPATDRFRVR
jgi:streptogramin lyase